MRALFDSNILIDFLNGVEAAKRELALYESRAISVITWMEVLAGAPEAADAETRSFLEQFDRVGIDTKIALRAVELRRTKRIKLPDAVILASAQIHGLLLVTRNTHDFDPELPGVRMPYRI